MNNARAKHKIGANTMTDFLKIQSAQGKTLKVLVVMAADAEYGNALKSIGVKPSIIGVGPIESAINMTILLKDLENSNNLPDLVVNLGSAGSDQHDQGTILQASSISYRDMDASPFGFEKGKTPFSTLPAKLPIDIQIPDVGTTSLSTGATVISNGAENEYDHLKEMTAEMEAYAIDTSCIKLGIPMIKILGISDGKQALEGKETDWTQHLSNIDKGLANAVSSLKEALESKNTFKLSLPTALTQSPTTPTIENTPS